MNIGERQAYTTEMHRMAGVVAAIHKSSMTDSEKLKATDAVAGSMLAVAKLGLAACNRRGTH